MAGNDTPKRDRLKSPMRECVAQRCSSPAEDGELLCATHLDEEIQSAIEAQDRIDSELRQSQ